MRKRIDKCPHCGSEKVEDKEVIKALTFHADGNGHCLECPIRIDGCSSIMASLALKLINRQKAYIAYWMDEAVNAKKEAVKEFAERLKGETLIAYNYPIQAVIDKVLKEIMEENKK